MNFWTDNRFMVTGGTGFLGSAVVDVLRKRGAPHIFTVTHDYVDLRRIDDIRGILYNFQPTVVIHLAAVVGGIGANQERPAEFFYDNLLMGAQLLHESYRADVQKFVTVGTVCSYPKYTPAPFSENDLWNGYPEETNAPYGIAKKALLVQGQAYRQQYGFNSIYLIPTNLYGPMDNFAPASSHVIPALIMKFTEAKEQGNRQVVVWGTGTPTRDFVFVDDAAEAIVLATEHYNKAEPVNIGTQREISIGDLAGIIARLVGFDGEIVFDTTKPDGQPRRLLDTTRAFDAFGFRASTTLEDGLQRTIEWYQSVRKNALEYERMR